MKQKLFTLILLLVTSAGTISAQNEAWTEIKFTTATNRDDFPADTVFKVDDSGFQIKICDTDNKMAIDGNTARFGTADGYDQYDFRLKTGSKSVANKNHITVSIPADGKLDIAARTGTNDDTTRVLYIIQGSDTVYNDVVRESQAIKVTESETEVNIYPFVDVPVKAGNVVVNYTGSLNFYSFKYKGNLMWYIADSTLTISGVGTMTNYYVLSSIPWYSYRTSIKTVIIKDGVTSIGDNAFYGCTSLTSIEIPNSVTSIGYGAFGDCTGLTSVTLPNSVTSVGSYAFYECTGLTSVNIPNSVMSIGECAFGYCTGLTSVTISNSVTNIGWGAFIHCGGMTSVTIGNSVTNIGEKAFYGCTGLSSVILNSNFIVGKDYTEKSNISSIFGSKIKEYIMGDSIKSIGSCAFFRCDSMTSVTIGNNVTSIGDKVFYGCIGLTSITIPNSVTTIGDEAFRYCYRLDSVHISDIASWCAISFQDECANPLDQAYNLYLNGNLITDLVIPNGVASIGKFAFCSCRSLISVTIPESVMTIGNFTFYGCGSLRYATIPGSVTSIGNAAFKDCNSLTINVPCKEKERFKQLLNNDSRIRGGELIDYSQLVKLRANSAKGKIKIDIEPDDCDSLMTISAIPNEKCDFFMWNDGSIDNPHTIKVNPSSASYEALFRYSDVTKSYLNLNQGGLGEMTTDNSEVWTYNSQYGAYGCKSGGVTGNLFTPIMDLRNAEKITMSFSHAHKFAGTPSSEFTLWVTSDFKGTWENSKWQQISISPYATNNDWNFVNVTINVPIQYVGKNTVFAFHYMSTATNFGTWEIKYLKFVIKSGQVTITDASNPQEGYIDIKSSYEYLSNAELVPCPYYGYKFAGWSDGNTDNPRTIDLIRDTTFAAVFERITSGTCGRDEALTWHYDREKTILTISGDGTLDANYTYGLEAPGNMTSLIIGENVINIGESAFAGNAQLTSIYNYRERPTKLGANAFKDVDYFNCTLYVPAGSVDMYKSSGSDWKDFYFIEPISAQQTTTEDVVVAPHDNTADIVWPAISGANAYLLIITDSEGDQICTLTFNANGQLIALAFHAPARNNATQQQTEQVAGFHFTITGLEAATRYAYTLLAKDAQDQVLETYTGTFTTNGLGYTIKFVNWDGSVLQSSFVEENDMPSYNGNTPTRPDDEEYTYTFKGWTPDLVAVTEDATYTAIYTAIPSHLPEGVITCDSAVRLTASFVDPIEVRETTEGPRVKIRGYVTFAYSPSEKDGMKTQSAWLSDIKGARKGEILASWLIIRDAVVTGDYVEVEGTLAKYLKEGDKIEVEVVNGTMSKFKDDGTIDKTEYFTVRFVNWDGSVLQSSFVEENNMPSYNGNTPTRPDDEEYTYIFMGWTPDLVAVTEDATYTATFEEHPIVTDIDNVSTATSARKILRNGQILILRREKVYTLTGQEVR